MGKNGHGWRRFLLFAELTKGRKGAEYVALFTHFSFEEFVAPMVALEMLIRKRYSPRQIINAVTLYTVMQANLVPVGQHAANNGHTPVAQFFVNVRILADANGQQAAILFGMLFTLVIWVFTAVGLLLACLFYVIFLWHHIPSMDRTLARYCRRKVDKRLAQIVGVKINKAIERENKQMAKGTAQNKPQLKHQPTLPIIDDDKSVLSRQTSQSTYAHHGPQSSIGSISRFDVDDGRRPSTLPGLNRPTPPSRIASESSAHSFDSYASDAPLIVGANAMGYSVPPRQYTPAAPSRMGSNHTSTTSKPNLNRLLTQNSQNSREASWSNPTSPHYFTESPYGYSASPLGSAYPTRATPSLSRSATPASFSSQSQARKALPRSLPQERDSYELQSRVAGPGISSPTSTGYTAYNPRMQASRNATPFQQRQYGDP
ncbi:MAG: hypothetical protein Q9195_000113 [Heterodermia aff. obscurata]